MEIKDLRRNGKIIGKVYRNENYFGQLDLETGPALVEEVPNGKPYMEWWRNGKMIATYNGEKLEKSDNGEYSGLKEVEIPQKWSGVMQSLSIDDISSCAYKQIVEYNAIQDITKNGEVTGKIYRNETLDGRLHKDVGPAVMLEENGKKTHMEWWNQGKLVAMYDANQNTFKKTDTGQFIDLKEATIPPIYEGLIESIRLNHLKDFKFKNQEIKMEGTLKEDKGPTIVKSDGSEEWFPKQIKTRIHDIKVNGEITGTVFRKETENGRLHSTSEPALYQENKEGKPYMEWWNNGNLVSTYDGTTFKKSTDGAFTGLKEAVLPQKWESTAGSLDLNDIALCSFKPEVKADISDVKSKIGGLREQFTDNRNNNHLKNKM